ncbi:ShlB/FhaC/HecB family hemolysin secretion/activation protein [Pelomonas sp. KK5]|uniref:ShlB/FhaC/HecB family hemolysin secretion/activation protein n=1 Tax=Pelomonas sp. KK5 TaxID=1855730 RepID=UPI00097C450E|nr:ShlB/FhaC/HecB family hemolysin secretion/activation protein [Pelomonas sp. KK5]
MGLLGLSLALAAHGQQASPTPPVIPTPDELARQRAPQRPESDAKELPQRPLPKEMARPQDDALTVDVQRYVIDGPVPEKLAAALPRLTEAYVGKARTYEDLVDATVAVTRFLQSELGYYLGYAYLPAQAPQDGTVHIAILEGRLDKAVLKGGDGLPVKREVLQAYLDRLTPGEILKVQDVERVVFLLNDLRGVSVKAEVRPGTQPGTAILEFTPTADSRWELKADGDANGSTYIGRFRLGATGYWNSPLGRGDSVSGSVLASGGGGLRFALIGYNTPLGSNGLKAGVSVSTLKYKLDEADFPLGLYGDGRTINTYVLYPWVRSRNLNLFQLAAIDDKRYDDTIAGITTRKQIRDAVLGITGDFRDSLLGGAVNTFEVNYSKGRLKYPASASGLPSGVDDDLDYAKFNFAYSRLQSIVEGRLLGYLNLRGQQSLNNLDSTEQFRAGGPDGLRGFAPGDGTGDSGVIASLELRWLPPEAWFGRWAREIVLGVFADAAQIRYRKDSTRIPRDPAYVNTARLSDVGLSLVWARPAAYALRLSVASPMSGKDSVADASSTRVYLQATWFF